MSRIHTVTTSPAIYIRDEIYPHAPTFSELVSRIQDEIDDTTNEYLQQVQKCIFSAVRYCEREPFYFNQSRDIVFLTEKGRGRYGEEDNYHISTAVQIKEIYREEHGFKQALDSVSPDHMERHMATNVCGRPTSFSYFDRALFLYPIPDAVYTLRLILTPMRVDEIRDVDELGVWFTEGFDLIRARAKYELYSHYIKDENAAARALLDFQDQLGRLRYETSKRQNCDRIIPTEF